MIKKAGIELLRSRELIVSTSSKPEAGRQIPPDHTPEFCREMVNCLEFFQKHDFGHPNGIRRIMALLYGLLEARCVLLSSVDFDQDTISIVDEYGCPGEFGRDMPVTASIGYREFITQAQPIAIYADLEKSPYWNSNPQIRGLGLGSYIGCPVKHHGRVIGFLEAFDSKPRDFSASQAGVMGMTALMISFAQSNRRTQSLMEDRLKESEAITYQMLQLSPLAIYKIDLLQQRFIAVNQEMCRATGYTEQELLAMKPFDLLTPRSRMLFLRRCQAMAAGESVTTDVELEVKTKDGGAEWGHFHIRHILEEGKITGANVVVQFISDQKRNREELAAYRKRLEILVQARTEELARANAQLREEIKRRAEASEKLRASSDNLKEMNTAMRVLLDKRIEDHQRAEEIIRMNLKELIDPYLDRLENSGLQGSQNQLLDVIRMNLEEVLGSAIPEFSSKYYMLSPNEIQVVNLIRKGKTTKEMSRLLNLSVRTIEAYRNSIRRKFNLKNKKINLRTYLSSI
jgi:PAS domain S-box-containing protein